MKTKTPIDLNEYQPGRLTDADRRVLESLAEAGYQLSVAALTCERSGQYWQGLRVIVRRAS